MLLSIKNIPTRVSKLLVLKESTRSWIQNKLVKIAFIYNSDNHQNTIEDNLFL